MGDIFKQYGVIAGISLDGPKVLHDKHRQFSNGKENFESVIRGVEALRSFGIDFAIISVVVQETMKIPKEVFNFLTSQN